MGRKIVSRFNGLVLGWQNEVHSKHNREVETGKSEPHGSARSLMQGPFTFSYHLQSSYLL